MRLAALIFVASLAVASAGSGAHAEYYCSPGFEPTFGGQCVATLSRDQIQLYLNEPVAEAIPTVRSRHHRRRHGLAARY